MPFLKPEKFIHKTFIKEGITFVADKTGYERLLIEQIIDDFFINLKELIVQQTVYKIKIINWGTFSRRKSTIEKAQEQLLEEQARRENELNHLTND